MDFFGHQEQALRATRRLVILYALAVVAIITLLYFALWASLRGASTYSERLASADTGWINWELLVAVAAGVLVVVGFGSLFKVSQLRSGGAVVASRLGGRYVQPNTTDDLERRLINVIEEMAIASGTAVPNVFILDREPGINAFAAGWTPDDAAIAVTRGCLELLTRDELQGVIAHEFSHVFHGDMRLNIRMLGILHGITCIAIGGSVLLRVGAASGGSRRKESGAPLLALAIAMLVVGYIGVFFARLIKAGVSRQREFLADAAAAQYTRNPVALARALRRIVDNAEGSHVHHGRAEDASHMFFANALGRSWLAMFATHPPVEERIQRLDRHGRATVAGERPDYTQATAAAQQAAAQERDRAGLEQPGPAAPGGLPGIGLPGVQLPGGLGAAAAAAIAVSPDALVDTVGEPQVEHVARARAILQTIPRPLVAAAHEPYSARALLCALLLDDTDAIRDRQLEIVQEHLGLATRKEAVELQAAVRDLPTAARLPLVELALPGLRNASHGQFEELDKALLELAAADEEISPFEMAMHKIVRKHLSGHFDPRPGARPKFRTTADVEGPLTVLLSVLARAGQAEDEAAAALAAAAPVLRTPLTLATKERGSMAEVDAALAAMALASPSIKRTFLLAAARVVARDGLVSIAEGELVRAFAEVLDCPMPPILAKPDDA